MPSVANAGTDPMTKLQNRWYNSLTTHLHLDRSLFQIRQSLDPIIRSNKELYMAQNVIPPSSLTFNSSIYQGELFFDEYAAIIEQFQYPEPKFREDIGEEVYQKWLTYLKSLTPPPSDNKLPALFRQWSLIHAPSVMNVGVADLSQMVLIKQALGSLQAYQGPNAKMIDFSGNYTQMIEVLNSSTGAGFVFESNSIDDNVENTWTRGEHNGVAGLWISSCSNSRLSRQFALSNISVDVKFKSYAVFTSVPGRWYNSALLNTAYVNQNTPPWPVNPNPTWEDVFGENGSMLRLITSLVVADGMNTTISSDTNFSEADQQTIRRNTSKGLWPFYTPSRNGIASNVVTFDNDKGMEIKIVTQPGNPVLIGENVLGMAQYLGHAIS